MYVQGKNSILYIKWREDWVPISCEVSNTMSESSDMIDTTTRDNGGWKTSRPNIQSYSISFTGHTVLEIADSVLNYFELVKIKRSKTLIEWQRRTENRMIESGMAYISDINNAYETEGIATFDMTLTGFGSPRLIDNSGSYEVLANYDDAILTFNINKALRVK